MSMAPVPWLRKWWSLGGAPAAFIQRDAELTRACERLLAQGDPAPTLDATASYATLIAPIDLSAALPIDVASQEIETYIESSARTRASRSTHTASAASRAYAQDLDQRNASKRRHAKDVLPTCVPTETEYAMQEGASPNNRPHSPRAANDEPAPLTRNLSSANDAPQIKREVPRWTSTCVPVVRCDGRSDTATHIDRLLAEFSSGAMALGVPRTAQSKGSAVVSAGSAPQKTNDQTGDRLGTLVQRVERHFVERETARTAVSWNSEVSRRNHPQASMSRARDAHESYSTTAERGLPSRREPGTQATGLRGLVERASFLGVRRDADYDRWPDSEIDRFARLIDDVARQEGVSLEEGFS